MQTPYNPMQSAYQTDPGLTYCGKRIVFAGSYFDFLLYLTEQKTHLHERLGTQEITATDALKLAHAVETARPDPADRVDFTDEIQAIEALQADLGARFTISGGEVIELSDNPVCFDEPSDEEYPF